MAKETVQLKPSELKEGIKAVEILAKENIKKYRFSIAVTLQNLRRADEAVQQARNDLDDEHLVKDDDGLPVLLNQSDGTSTFKVKNQGAYMQALKSFRADSLEVDIWTIPLSALEKTKVSAAGFWPPLVDVDDPEYYDLD